MSKRKPITIELPIAMPTWNRLLANNRFQNKAIRHLIHEIVDDAVYGRDTNEWMLKE